MTPRGQFRSAPVDYSVTVPCPLCEDDVVVYVNRGEYQEITDPCDQRCHLKSNYPRDLLAARAEREAEAERDRHFYGDDA
jgi:hypothetical protein